MAEQLLDRPQIAAASEQVRGETVAQRMRRGGLWQAKRAAQSLHLRLNSSRPQRAAAHAAKERGAGLQIVRAERRVMSNSLAHSRQERDEP